MLARMQVRAYGERDRAELERLVTLMYPEASAQEIARLLERRPHIGLFVIARDDGRLGGYVEAGTRDYAEGCDSSPVAFVEAWYVDVDLRRGGWGGRLIAAVEAWARARGHTELASDTWPENAASIAAHERLGFTIVERLVCFRKPL
jgi:aminoglycoside 6'-N-acetyltransferase I